MKWSPLTTNWAVNLVDCSRRTAPVDSIGHHHTATPDKLTALALFAPGGRTVTPNYFIAGKEIWGIVPEDYRAYTSGSVDDHRSITYEILNSSGGPSWSISRDTLETVARLDADISRRYGIRPRHGLPGFYEHRNLYEWFGRSYPTACAGPSFRINDIIAATAAQLTLTPGDPEKEDEDMSWKPEVIARVDGNKDGEWMLVHPEIGADLKPGNNRKEGAITVFRGYMVTASQEIGHAWGRLYARQYGNVPTRLTRDRYIAIQAVAKQVSVELAQAVKG